MNLPFAQASCIILSAGSSERMGEHKALLKFDKHTTFIQQITGVYISAGVQQVIVVANSQLFDVLRQSSLKLSDSIEIVLNDTPERGRFYSLQTGLKKLKTGNYCFLQNVDNPFTSESLLIDLISYKAEADVIVPTFQNNSGHPVLFGPGILKQILNTEGYDIRIDGFINKYKCRKVITSESSILANINSPEEYRAARFPFHLT
jgi:molybdenum cofactor cytidylyltransferase